MSGAARRCLRDGWSSDDQNTGHQHHDQKAERERTRRRGEAVGTKIRTQNAFLRRTRVRQDGRSPSNSELEVGRRANLRGAKIRGRASRSESGCDRRYSIARDGQHDSDGLQGTLTKESRRRALEFAVLEQFGLNRYSTDEPAFNRACAFAECRRHRD